MDRGDVMTEGELKQEIEKRVRSFDVHVYRTHTRWNSNVNEPMPHGWPDDDSTVYHVRLSLSNTHAERWISVHHLNNRGVAMLDNEAHALIERWAIERYFIQPKDRV
jgi:hypothetical protein